MKKRISVEDLQELSAEQKEKLREWWKPEEGDHFAEEYEGIYYSKVNGSCQGYNVCECIIDDGEDPAERPNKNALPLLSIGQMIEIIQEHDECLTMTHMLTHIDGQTVWGWEVHLRHFGKRFNAVELADTLLEAVKSVL